MKDSRKQAWSALMAGAAILFSACGGEDPPAMDDDSARGGSGGSTAGSGGDGGAGGSDMVSAGDGGTGGNGGMGGNDAGAGGGEPSQDDSLFLVHSATSSPDGRTNFFTLTDSIQDEETLDYTESIELVGRARLYAKEGLDFVLIGDAEALSLTRFELTEQGALQEGESVSLQGEGVTSLGAQALFFESPTKAYYKDNSEGQIIVLNPETMTIEDTILLPDELIKEGYVLGMSDWAARDGDAFFAVRWSAEAYDRVLEGTALVHLDTETDTITVTEDSRCRGLTTAANVDGTLYFFSGVINGFGYTVHGEEGGQQDCILRIPEGESEFDSDYVGTLSDALPDNREGAAQAVTEDGTIWVQAADLDAAPTMAGATYSDWYAADWTWWRVPLDTLDEASQVDVEAGAYSGFTFETDSGLFISRTEADYSETTLVDVSGEAQEPGISFAGFTLDVAQLR